MSSAPIGLPNLVLTATCSMRGNKDRGRLFMEQRRFSNANEMAQPLLLGMSLWWAPKFDVDVIAPGLFRVNGPTRVG